MVKKIFKNKKQEAIEDSAFYQKSLWYNYIAKSDVIKIIKEIGFDNEGDRNILLKKVREL